MSEGDTDKSARGTQLERVQRWMQAIITHPHGVGAGVASEEARRSIDVDPDALETVVTRSPTQSGAERLAVYARSYRARLLECFRTMFPALERALGEELFNRFALDYLRRHPPNSYSLDHLADHFPRHLAETRPDADAPPGERESWPDFVVELATLEWAFLKIYDGPGTEGRGLPRADDILNIEPERIRDATPAPAPCLRLFAFRYPVHTYMLAARRDEKPELPAPADSFVVVTRSNYRVRLYDLSAPQHALLQSFDGRHTVGQILDRSARPDDQHLPPVAAVRDWLCDWADKDFFSSVELTNGAGGPS